MFKKTIMYLFDPSRYSKDEPIVTLTLPKTDNATAELWKAINDGKATVKKIED